jgi:hypothetical protein
MTINIARKETMYTKINGLRVEGYKKVDRLKGISL